MIYQRLVRPLLFRFDPEWTHDQAIAWGAAATRIPGLLRWASRMHGVDDTRLNIDVAGIPFKNPLGLAAGYDKSGRAVAAMASLGFGHVEIGSVSAMPSAGNPKPRLWRLPIDDAICVHYGLPNEGAAAVAKRLQGQRIDVPLGINLVNTNHGVCSDAISPDEILQDYVTAAETLRGCASYFMLNLSCPNTSDGREFFDAPGHLGELLERLASIPIDVPLLLKLSPDWDDAAIDRMLQTVDGYASVAGFMFNLSSRRRSGLATPCEIWNDWPGAISGSPTKDWMDRRIVSLYRQMDRRRYRIIAAGGVATAEDAYRKLRAGASLVQLLTALVYQGPRVVRRINRGLLELLERDGVSHVQDIVGADVSGV
ncbi:Dihydroorotate dehydrogenase (quinone) [Stieleria neptunia]|uniref:Dihydroorotate dehydrogenase (quinone) n=1 Tax=Stieleria neptunia TaxID=2527979 RepID=A0A518HZZ1_9BACT|nr:quinone-dependent dihydroorotate dehydrogenase [Stieleria neptunia]QDV46314.1 Dihydroorotate dehydrogenase (quinone) [Stieleria neptunia]